MSNYYGYKESLKINKDTAYKSIKTPDDLYNVLDNLWSLYTCAPRLREGWSKDNKTLGQCSITAFLVEDIFGGEVYALKTKNGLHCFNVVDGIKFDLTSEQFKESAKDLDYECVTLQNRNSENHFKKEEKFKRYLYLKNKLNEYLKGELNV